MSVPFLLHITLLIASEAKVGYVHDECHVDVDDVGVPTITTLSMASVVEVVNRGVW